MEQTPPQRNDEEVKELLRQYLAGMDIEIVKEVEQDANWGIWTKFGNFPVLIDHRKDTHFCVVAFQITLQDEHAIAHLNNFYESNDAQFIYELTRSFSSPLTAFSRIVERGQVIGYTVSKHIYPYHPEFSMRTLDIALQAVVGTGAIGVAFLKWMAKVLDVKHERGIEVEDEDPTKLFE